MNFDEFKQRVFNERPEVKEEYDKLCNETIKAAAIRYRVIGSDEFKVVTGPHHASCIEWFSCVGLYSSKRDSKVEEQGFITSNENRFVDRHEAYIIAKQAGQLLRERDDMILFSQDLEFR